MLTICMQLHLTLLCLLPFLGALLLQLVAARLYPARIAQLSTLFIAMAGYHGWQLAQSLLQQVQPTAAVVVWYPFLVIDTFVIDAGLRFDTLSATMSLLVCLVSVLVHIYSYGYFYRQPVRLAYYYKLLLMFTGMMLLLVCSSSLPWMFLGWEGVGVCSYALVGFFCAQPSHVQAAARVMVINRIGDAGLLLAMAVLWRAVGTLQLTEIMAFAASHQIPDWALWAVAAGLLMAIAAKSAQWPLHWWLPDAMCGPTPASALIHAATMVTAGVYLAARFAPVWSALPATAMVLGSMGALTALLAASCACVQQDCKKVLAYSTISQLGYMVLACGVLAPDAALFHLLTHAGFKAALFLLAGFCIHHAGGKQNFSELAGVGSGYVAMRFAALLAVLSMTGFPPFAGFVSKEGILSGIELALSPTHVLFQYATWLNILMAAMLLTTLLTSFYMWRWFLALFVMHPSVNPSVHHEHRRVTVADTLMQVPIVVLAVLGAIVSPLNWPQAWGGHAWLSTWLHLAPLPAAEMGGGWWLTISTVVLGVTGLLLALATRQATITAATPSWATQWWLHGGHWPALIDRSIVNPGRWFASVVIAQGCERVCQVIPWLLYGLIEVAGFLGQMLQNGQVSRYVAVFLVMVAWAVYRGTF